jgi:hypothetical protein
MAKIQVWSQEEAQKELQKRLNFSRQARSKMEKNWYDSEKIAYATSFTQAGRASYQTSMDQAAEGVDGSSADVNISYAFKNFRFLHAQLSANPPSCVARPASNDPSDRQKADAADRLIRHAIRQRNLQEKVDQTSLQTLLYGTGFLKTVWDAHKGAILEVDEDNNLITEGDLDFSVPATWDIFVDPDADCWDDVRFVFERMFLPVEEALFRWPEAREAIEQAKISNGNSNDYMYTQNGTSPYLGKEKFDVVEVYEYWEKGLPTNAYLGRYAVCLKDGKTLDKVKPSPFRFKPADDEKAKYEIAGLPYHIFTDVDVPQMIWGKSFLDYIAPIQDTMNRLDSLNLDNIQAHGVTRLLIPDATEITEMITNSPWDVVKMTGTQPPFFMGAPQGMPMVDKLREQIRTGIDDISGVNESMFGQQSRETAGFAMQYAANQGNMIRKRLFNKYAMFTESIFRAYLNLIRKHWTTSRVIYVLGKEKALEAVEIKGADISGGFDLIVEYGQSLSLDPMTRRQEIMSLQPIFEKAGVPTRVSLKMMKLNELEGLYDMMQLAEDRQREIFEEMVATQVYLPPEELQDHENMLAYAMQYIMTTEYKYLDDTSKALIKQHVKDRAGLAAQERAGMPGGMPGVSQVPGAQAGGPMSPGPNAQSAQLPAQEAAPAGAQPAGTPPNPQ